MEEDCREKQGHKSRDQHSSGEAQGQGLMARARIVIQFIRVNNQGIELRVFAFVGIWDVRERKNTPMFRPGPLLDGGAL